MQVFDGYYSVCNHTKWMELRTRALDVETENRPEFRSKYIPNGHISNWDCEWFYHFRDGGFEGLEWIELRGRILQHKPFQNQIEEIGFVGRKERSTLQLFGYLRREELAEKLAF